MRPTALTLASLLCVLATAALAELTTEQRQVPLEIPPAHSAPGDARIVLIAGTPSNKPGQHESGIETEVTPEELRQNWGRKLFQKKP